MTLEDAIRSLVPTAVEPLSVADIHGLTLNVYPRERYLLSGHWLVVGDDNADKIGAALDGSGLYFLRTDGERFVNSTLELLRRFAEIYLVACEKEATPDALCRRFAQLDPPAMADTAAWFNFLDMVRSYP